MGYVQPDTNRQYLYYRKITNNNLAVKIMKVSPHKIYIKLTSYTLKIKPKPINTFNRRKVVTKRSFLGN